MVAHRGRVGIALFRRADPAGAAGTGAAPAGRAFPLARLSQAVAFTLGVFAGSMLWWAVLTGVIAVTASKLSQPVLR